MRGYAMSLPVLLVLASNGYAQQGPGAYTTYISGRARLVEKYTISTAAGGKTRVEAEVTAGSQVAQKMSMTLTPEDRPLEYSAGSGGNSVSVQLAGGSATLRLPGQTDRTVSTNATAIYVSGIWFPYIFLFHQYDTAKGGQQSFTAFSPTEGKDISITIEHIAPSDPAGPQSNSAESYRMILAGRVQAEVWTDRNRVPQVLAVPSQGLKVVKEGAESLADSVMKESPLPGVQRFLAEDVTFKNGTVQLAGTLTIPKSGKAPFPAAVLITGSGLQDRDNNPGGNSMFKLIAEKLSANGIAVLRHDDRGFGKSTNPTSATTYRDLINDTKSAVEYLRSRKEIDPDRIALIGHSEGAETAGILAEEDSKIAAIAILAGASRPLDNILIEQALYDEALKRPVDPSSTNEFPEIVRALIKISDDAKAGKQNQSVNDMYEWFRQHAAHDPVQTIRKLKCPILILQGERDEDALSYNGVALALAAARAGNKHVVLRVFPNLTHEFIASSLDKAATMEERGHVSQAMIDTLGKWAVATLVVKNGAEAQDQPESVH